MNIYKKCKVVMIPTDDEASNLCITDTGVLGMYQVPTIGITGVNQHLYILSDDEIQVGDWYAKATNGYARVSELIDNRDITYINCSPSYKKTIATTDPKLNLPSPSQAFIKKYVELEGIDEIMVQFSKETILTVDPPSGWKYGFPKSYPKDRQPDMLKWFVEQGYPQSEIDAYGDSFRYGCSEYPVETLKVSKNNTIIIKAVEVDNQKTIDHILKSACGYGMAETDEGKKAFIKCMNSIPKVHFDDFIHTLSRIAEKSGAGGFKNM